MQQRNTEAKWKDLNILLSGFVRNKREGAVLRLLRALAIDKSNINAADATGQNTFKVRINDFFYRLMLGGKSTGIFMQLYNKLNDYGIGDPSFSLFIQELYKFWLLSSFTDPTYTKNKPYKGGNEVIAYDNKKILGFHVNAHSFDFVTIGSRLKIKVTRKEKEIVKRNNARGKGIATKTVLVGIYDLFQPITLMDVPKEGELEIPTHTIPAFYLKAIDDKNAWANVDKGIWLGVDIATTLIGIGNLAKLRHLRHLAKLRNVKPLQTLFQVKTAVSVIEVTSGTLNALLTLADSDSPFAQKLKQYVFWLEMAGLGTDVVVERLLRNAARESLTAIDEVARATNDQKLLDKLDEVTEHLEEVIELERDILKKFDLKIESKVLTDREFLKISRRIKKTFGVDLKIVDRNNENLSSLFRKWQDNPIYAVFHSKRFRNTRYDEVLDGPTVYFFKGQSKKIIAPIELTSYTVQHELYHLKLWHTIEKIVKKQVPRRIHEEYVLSEFVKNVDKWEISDLLNDLTIVNNRFRKREGLNFVDLEHFKNWNLQEELNKINF